MTQRSRLLAATIAVANRAGYAGVTVSAVIAEAGVSRPTFYDYFADRDECFEATIAHVHRELLAHVRSQIEGVAGAGQLEVAVDAIVSFAVSHAAEARFLTAESMSGGRRALDSRDAGIATLAAELAAGLRGLSARTPVEDIDARVLIGTVFRMLGARLRRGEVRFATLPEELVAWASSYRVPAGSRRWQTLRDGPPPAASRNLPDGPMQEMPRVFGPGRPRVPDAEIAENHRSRILYATARLAKEKGFSATTVADITRLARIDGRVFYRLFADKQEAFLAAHELGVQQVMDVTSSAFFSVQGWPERSWEAGLALAGLLDANPMIAHVGFVEAYAVGPAAVQRVEDSRAAFLFFLQEGLLARPGEEPPSRVAMEAIIASVFEVVYLRVRQGESAPVATVLGYIAHLWLTPFLGVRDAEAFIRGQQRGAKSGHGSRSRRQRSAS